jgi:hypothetical protein
VEPRERADRLPKARQGADSPAGEPEQTAGDLLAREERWVLKTRGVRFGIFVVLLLVFAGFLVVGQYSDALEVCKDALPTVGNDGVVATCGPPGLGDLWPLLLLALAPLLPDLGSLSIAGFLDVSRRLTRQEQRQQELVETTEQVESTSEEARALAAEAILDAVAGTLPQKEERYLRTLPSAGEAREELQDDEVQELTPADLESRLLWSWSLNLAPAFEVGQELRRSPHFRDDFWLYLQTPGTAERERAAILARWPRRARQMADRLPRELTTETLSAYERWLELFDSELRAVRATRNAVAHPPHDLSRDQIADAVRVADRLSELLFTGLQFEAGLNE